MFLYWPLLLLTSTGVGATATHFVFNVSSANCLHSVSHLPHLPLALYLEVLHDTPSCLGVPTGPEALSWSSWCTGPESQIASTALLSLSIPVPTLFVTFPPRPRAVTESILKTPHPVLRKPSQLLCCRRYTGSHSFCYFSTSPSRVVDTENTTPGSFILSSGILCPLPLVC